MRVDIGGPREESLSRVNLQERIFSRKDPEMALERLRRRNN